MGSCDMHQRPGNVTAHGTSAPTIGELFTLTYQGMRLHYKRWQLERVLADIVFDVDETINALLMGGTVYVGGMVFTRTRMSDEPRPVNLYDQTLADEGHT